jgi:hypothetical protein
MCHTARPTLHLQPRSALSRALPGGLGARALGTLGAAAAIAMLAPMPQAQAQMVPQAQHAFHQSATGDLTETRIAWRASVDTNADDAADTTGGKGLNLRGHSLWPHWEGRIGVVVDRPINPLKDSFVLTQPMSVGLKVRSMHMLSDYYLDGGFRATAGLVRGDNSQAWWSGGDHGGGLNLSLQRIDSLGLVASNLQVNPAQQQTSPYLGAGYSTRLNTRGVASSWRFNADLGLITINSNNIGRISQVLQGDMGVDALLRDLRLRPVIKVSVGYAF